MEQRTGFWTAYLLCFCVFIIGIAILLAGKKQYIMRPPRGSVIPNAFKYNMDWVEEQRQYGYISHSSIRT